MSKQSYVVGFMLDDPEKIVVLIQKRRPAWQAGLFNGVGGKIEPGETPLQAMEREFVEETGVLWRQWEPFAVLDCNNHESLCHFFVSRSTMAVQSVMTRTDETIYLRGVDEVMTAKIATTPNLRLMLALALDKSGLVKPIEFVDEIVVGRTASQSDMKVAA